MVGLFIGGRMKMNPEKIREAFAEFENRISYLELSAPNAKVEWLEEHLDILEKQVNAALQPISEILSDGQYLAEIREQIRITAKSARWSNKQWDTVNQLALKVLFLDEKIKEVSEKIKELYDKKKTKKKPLNFKGGIKV
jgi:chromosome segregation ATPase